MSIKIDYTQTTWVNEVTPLNAQNMNNIDRALTSIKASLDDKEFTATSVGADPTGTATNVVAEHNNSNSAHEATLAKKVHTHTLSQITNFPRNTPNASDNDKVLVVKNGTWTANKLNFADISGTVPYADISGAPEIPTKLSDLENDVGYVTRGEVDQPAVIETVGNSSPRRINLEFGYAPDHLVIEDYVSGSTTPTAVTTVDRNYSQPNVEFVWGDFDVAIVSSAPTYPFNVTGHTYKVWAYALTSPNQVPNGDIIIAEDGQWTHADPSDLGFTSVIANPSATAVENLTKVTIGDTTYNVVGVVDSAISSTSTNPVQNRVIYNQFSYKEDNSNKVTTSTLTSSNTTTQYPSAKTVYDFVTGRIVANNGTPTDTLNSIKIGDNVYGIDSGSPIIKISTTDFTEGGSLYEYKFKAADSTEVTTLNAMITNGEQFTLTFSLDNSVLDSGMHIDAFATVGRTESGNTKTFFTGVARIVRGNPSTQVLNGETVPFQMTLNANATYPFEMYFAFPVGITAASELPVQSGAVYTALQGKESTSNKVTTITTTSTDTQYPSAKAVYSYVQANPSGQTSTVDLNYLRVGDGLYRISSGSSITVDDTLSTSSENPVQNKVISNKISAIEGNVTSLGQSVLNMQSTITTQSTLLNNKVGTSAIVTNWSDSPSDSKIPSEKLVKDSIDTLSRVTATTLWSGSQMADTGTSITLPEYVSTFDAIEVYVTSGTNPVCCSVGKCYCTIYDTRMVINALDSMWSETQIRLDFLSKNLTVLQGASMFNITKVIGYKFI